MIGKVMVRSYASVGSRLVRRKCPGCGRILKGELVDYGKGGGLVYLACGTVVDPKKRSEFTRGADCRNPQE